ncbi:hypothetical protein MRX96_007783 [Rhipicephalus microplus]
MVEETVKGALNGVLYDERKERRRSGEARVVDGNSSQLADGCPAVGRARLLVRLRSVYILTIPSVHSSLCTYLASFAQTRKSVGSRTFVPYRLAENLPSRLARRACMSFDLAEALRVQCSSFPACATRCLRWCCVC